MNWFPYSVAATLSFGIAMGLYKLPAKKGYSSWASAFWANLFSALSVAVVLAVLDPTSLAVYAEPSLYALVWGVFFATHMVFVKMILHDAETNAIYPLTSSFSAVLTIIVGVTLLSDSLSLYQVAGIGLILLAVFVVGRKGEVYPTHPRALALMALAVLASVALKYVHKLGAVQGNTEQFMAWQYVGASLFVATIMLIFDKKALEDAKRPARYWKGAAVTGALMALGGFFIIRALQTGPFSGIFSIHATYVFVASLVGWLLFGEKFTTKKAAFALVSIAGVVLMRFG